MIEENRLEDINIQGFGTDSFNAEKRYYYKTGVVGVELKYDIIITNNTNDPAQPLDNIIVRETLRSEDFFFVKAEVFGKTVTITEANMVYSFAISGSLASGKSEILTVTVIPKRIMNGGSSSIHVSVEAPEWHAGAGKPISVTNISIVDVVENIGQPTGAGGAVSMSEKVAKLLGAVGTGEDDPNTIFASIGTPTGDPGTVSEKVDAILKKVDTIVNPDYYKLRTGIVMREYSAKSIVVTVENTTNVSAIIRVILVDHTNQSSVEVCRKDITLPANRRKTFVLGEPSLRYEVIFNDMREGLYAWTATRTNGVFDSLNVNGFIASNTFRHNDFIMVKESKK